MRYMTLAEVLELHRRIVKQSVKQGGQTKETRIQTRKEIQT